MAGFFYGSFFPVSGSIMRDDYEIDEMLGLLQ